MTEKAKLYMDFSAVDKKLVMEVPHTHHAVDEYLVFTGTDMNNFFESDAEVDIWLGKDPEREDGSSAYNYKGTDLPKD